MLALVLIIGIIGLTALGYPAARMTANGGTWNKEED